MEERSETRVDTKLWWGKDCCRQTRRGRGDRLVQMSDTFERHKDPGRVGNSDRQTDRQVDPGEIKGSISLLSPPNRAGGSKQGTLCGIRRLFPLPLCHLLLLFLHPFLVSTFFPLFFFYCFISSLVSPSSGFPPLFCASDVCRPSRGAVPTLVWWSCVLP